MPQAFYLKNCPFCNGEAHMVNGQNENEYRPKWYAECMNPDCWIAGRMYETPEAAAAFWNRREYAQSEIET